MSLYWWLLLCHLNRRLETTDSNQRFLARIQIDGLRHQFKSTVRTTDSNGRFSAKIQIDRSNCKNASICCFTHSPRPDVQIFSRQIRRRPILICLPISAIRYHAVSPLDQWKQILIILTLQPSLLYDSRHFRLIVILGPFTRKFWKNSSIFYEKMFFKFGDNLTDRRSWSRV